MLHIPFPTEYAAFDGTAGFWRRMCAINRECPFLLPVATMLNVHTCIYHFCQKQLAYHTLQDCCKDCWIIYVTWCKHVKCTIWKLIITILWAALYFKWNKTDCITFPPQASSEELRLAYPTGLLWGRLCWINGMEMKQRNAICLVLLSHNNPVRYTRLVQVHQWASKLGEELNMCLRNSSPSLLIATPHELSHSGAMHLKWDRICECCCASGRKWCRTWY